MTFTEQLAYIMEKFRWYQVAAVMTALDWHWASGPGRTPTVDEMKSTAHQLLGYAHSAMEESPAMPSYSVSTGGFKASAVRREDGTVRYTLAFIAEDCAPYF